VNGSSRASEAWFALSLPTWDARPGLDKHRLGELIDLIGTIALEQETLSFALREQTAAYHAAQEAKPVEPSGSATDAAQLAGTLSPADELFRAVREILKRELREARSQAEVVALLGVAKSQAKEWLTRLVAEGTLEKVSKPTPLRYRVLSASDRLL